MIGTSQVMINPGNLMQVCLPPGYAGFRLSGRAGNMVVKFCNGPKVMLQTDEACTGISYACDQGHSNVK